MKILGKVLALVLAVVLVLGSMTAFADEAEVEAEAAAEVAAEVSEPVTGVFATVTGGELMGYRYDGVDTYFAIPYGTAERFQPAQPASWEGLYCANVMGEMAPQSSHATASRDLFNCFPYNLLQVENEEKCLDLNVWTQETGGEATRPVIV